MGRLTARHLELYRLMWAKAWPSRSGRPVCKWGQAKLGAWMDPPIGPRQVKRLVADLRGAAALDTHRQAAGGGYRGRGQGGNWNVLALEPARLARLISSQVDEHMPWSAGGDMEQSGLLPDALEGTSAAMSPTRYVRSVVATTGEEVPGGGVGGAGGEGEPNSPLATRPTGSDLETAPRTNNGLRRWVPTNQFVRDKALRIAREQGVANAERYLDACKRREQRQQRQREAGQQAIATEAAIGEAAPTYGRWGQDRVDKFKSRQEREAVGQVAAAVSIQADAVVQPATIAVTAGLPRAGVAVTAQTAGEQRTAGRTSGHRVEVGQAVERELAGEVTAAVDAEGTLDVAGEVHNVVVADRIRLVG